MRLRIAAIIVVLSPFILPGCAAFDGTGRSLGKGVIGGLQQYTTQQPTSDSTRVMFDSIASYAGAAIRDHLRPAIDSTMNGLLDRTEQTMLRAEAMVNRLEDTTVSRLNGPLNDALAEMIRTNSRVLGDEGRQQVTLMLRELRAGFENELTPMLHRTIASVVDTMSMQLAANLRGDMLRALARAADSIAAAGARAAVRAGDEGVQQTSFMRNLRRWGPLIAIAVLLVALGWYWYTRRRSERALEAVASAIRDSEDTDLKSEVKVEALRRNVEPWLNKFLQRRGYVDAQPPPRR